MILEAVRHLALWSSMKLGSEVRGGRVDPGRAGEEVAWLWEKARDE